MQHSLIVILWSLFVSFHDFHVTHTNIFYNADKESLEITINVAIADLERALEDQIAKKISIGTNVETESVDELIESYFRQRLTIAPNNRLTQYQWVGKEVSKDLHNIYIYFEVLNCNQNGEIESLLLENSIFTDIQPEQANIVLFDFRNESRNLTFTRLQKRQNIVF
tara:strand:+ start:297 stop:797 length:501 start_codon:yes stop_codon:yes gene_type:complete